MTTQAWLVFTPAQSAAAVAASASTTFKVYPRAIDAPTANQLGDPVVIVGNLVAPARILNDPDYAPVWAASLSGLPIRVLDSDVLFLPPDF
jgi:hypothetical protein